MSQTEDEDGTTVEFGRDGWVAVLLIVVIALLALWQHHGIHLGRW